MENTNICPICKSKNLQLVLIRSRIVPVNEKDKIIAPITNVYGDLCLDCGRVVNQRVKPKDLENIKKHL
jgi:hypothetical protein